MSAALMLACVWLVTANVIGMFPSKHAHWPAAYALIALGLPILGWVFWQDGPWAGLVVLAAAASVLRWPVRYLLRWVAGLIGIRAEG
jgi:hypothetical protein